MNNPVEVTKDLHEEIISASIRFPDPDQLYEILNSDFETGEEVTLTITGLIRGFNVNDQKDYRNASLDIDITDISGSTQKKKVNDKEMKDMDKMETDEEGDGEEDTQKVNKKKKEKDNEK